MAMAAVRDLRPDLTQRLLTGEELAHVEFDKGNNRYRFTGHDGLKSDLVAAINEQFQGICQQLEAAKLDPTHLTIQRLESKIENLSTNLVAIVVTAKTFFCDKRLPFCFPATAIYQVWNEILELEKEVKRKEGSNNEEAIFQRNMKLLRRDIKFLKQVANGKKFEKTYQLGQKTVIMDSTTPPRSDFIVSFIDSGIYPRKEVYILNAKDKIEREDLKPIDSSQKVDRVQETISKNAERLNIIIPSRLLADAAAMEANERLLTFAQRALKDKIIHQMKCLETFAQGDELISKREGVYYILKTNARTGRFLVAVNFEKNVNSLHITLDSDGIRNAYGDPVIRGDSLIVIYDATNTITQIFDVPMDLKEAEAGGIAQIKAVEENKEDK